MKLEHPEKKITGEMLGLGKRKRKSEGKKTSKKDKKVMDLIK